MQEFRVLKCSECQTIQVDIVKKDKKWKCKLCDQKQLVKLVYFKSHKAVECREKAEDLRWNLLETEKLELARSLEKEEEDCVESNDHLSLTTSDSFLIPEPSSGNKWLQFLSQNESRKEQTNENVPLRKPLNRSDNDERPTEPSVNKWESLSNFQPKPAQMCPSGNKSKKRSAYTSTEPPQKKVKTLDEINDNISLKNIGKFK